MAKSKKIRVHTKAEETVIENRMDQKNDPNKEDKTETVDPLKEMEEKLESMEQEVKENFRL
jgi:hypothetical protein